MIERSLDAILYFAAVAVALLPQVPSMATVTIIESWRKFRPMGAFIPAARAGRVLGRREAGPSACVIDSQSFKTTERGGVTDMMAQRSWDATQS